MADDIKTVGDSVQQPETTPAGTATSTPEELQKLRSDFETLSKEFSLTKKELSSRDKKITDLQKVIDDKELEKLDEVGKAQALAKKAQEEQDRILSENAKLLTDRIKDKELNSAGIPVEFAKRIIGLTEAEIQSDVKDFKKFIDDLVKAQTDKEINKKLGGMPPASGQIPEAATYQSAYDDAMKNRKMAEATAIKRQAGKEGIEIKG